MFWNARIAPLPSEPHRATVCVWLTAEPGSATKTRRKQTPAATAAHEPRSVLLAVAQAKETGESVPTEF